MAVTFISSVQHFIGLSSDTKPTDDVPAGSTFVERNTGRSYIFDGAEWGLTYALPEDIVDINLLQPRTITGEAVLDEGEADWTDPTDLIVVEPADASPIRDAVLHIDLDKATTGFATGYSAQELTLAVLRKVDGTNWRQESSQAITGTAAAGRSVNIPLGPVGVDEAVKITAALDSEADGSTVAELPFALHYVAVEAPTVTHAEVGAE